MQQRLDLGLTQSQLAEQAGVAKRTLERIEAGGSTKMSSIIRILRVLDLVQGLNLLVPEIQARPMDLLKRKGKIRQRASKKQKSKQTGAPWSWRDDA